MDTLLQDLVVASARYEIDRLELQRKIRRLQGRASQTEIARASGYTQPRISQLFQQPSVEPPAGFSGASVKEIAQRYAAGMLSVEETVDQLARWKYAQSTPPDDWDDFYQPAPGSWHDVAELLRAGLITPEIYDAAQMRRHASAS